MERKNMGRRSFYQTFIGLYLTMASAEKPLWISPIFIRASFWVDVIL